MIYKKGFSLLEVLISLTIVTTLGLSLLKLREQEKQLLTQLTLRTTASQFLNRVDEVLLAGVDKIPRTPYPYIFVINKVPKSITLSLRWFGNFGSLVRKHHSIEPL